MAGVSRKRDEAATQSEGRLELLLFRLGASGTSEQSEFFGVNVLKVREIVALPEVVKVAGAGQYSMGVVHLRDQVIPVYDLPAIAGCRPAGPLTLMLVTESSSSVQALAVEAVEDIVGLDWAQVTAPRDGGLVSGIARLDGIRAGGSEAEGKPARLVQVLDLEAVLAGLLPKDERPAVSLNGFHERLHLGPEAMVLAADDSYVARALLEQTLKTLAVPHEIVNTGKAAWERLQVLAAEAQRAGRPVSDRVALVLTDLEMPEMDGFTLTQAIRQDPRLAALPVVVHSSMSGYTTREHARKVGANDFVAKFSAEELARALARALEARAAAQHAPA